MAGFLARAFAPLIGIGRGIIAFGLGAPDGGTPIALPTGEVLVRVEDIEPARVVAEDAVLARVEIADSGWRTP